MFDWFDVFIAQNVLLCLYWIWCVQWEDIGGGALLGYYHTPFGDRRND